MSIYPDNIFEGREVEDLPGINYNASDKTTIFAKDIGDLNGEVQAIEQTLGVNPQGDFATVADRLAAGGGGGGGSRLVAEAVVTSGQNKIETLNLDLQADKIYDVYFGVNSVDETTNFEIGGTSGIFMSYQGERLEGGSNTFQTGISWLSHPSVGPCTGHFTFIVLPNGTASALIRYTVANQRYYHLAGSDGNWYSGGVNLTYFRLKTATDWPLQNGSWFRIYKGGE